MTDFFNGIPKIEYKGEGADTEFAYRHYDPDEQVMGKRMEDHLRFAVAYWHSFAWEGGDPFGGQTFDRPWFGGTMDHAKMKADAAFEMFGILGQPFFCFHDADVRPEGETFAESRRNLEEITDYFGQKMEETGTKLLWGTANLFSHRRFMSGSATNPDPEVFAYAAATVKSCMDATKKLGGANYVLWGGREGYETLLNTDMGRERQQAGRFLTMVVDYAQQDRLRRHHPDRAQAAGADQAPVRLRRRDGLRLPQGVRARERGQGQHRAGPRHPRRPQLRARAGAGARARHPRLDRHEPQRLPVRLGHRPVPQQRARGGAGLLRGAARGRLHHRRHQLRRQAAAPVARPRGPDPRPCRRRWMSARAGLKAAAAMLEDGALEAARDRALRGLGTGREFRHARPRTSPPSPSGSSARASIPSRARAGRSGSRTGSTGSSEAWAQARFSMKE